MVRTGASAIGCESRICVHARLLRSEWWATECKRAVEVLGLRFDEVANREVNR